MSFSARKSIVQLYPSLRKGIEQVKREVLGHFPQTYSKTGYQDSKKPLVGVFLDQYYQDSLVKIARKNIPRFRTEEEDRRAVKLMQLRRRGKGPPKKGSGSRARKKKKK